MKPTRTSQQARTGMGLVVNLQRRVKVDLSLFKEFSNRLSAAVDEAKQNEFSVAFVSDRRMKDLNKFFRSKDSTTDVLSFPHEPDEFAQSAGFSPSLDDEELDESRTLNTVQSAGFSPSLDDEERDESRTLNADYLGDIVIS